jgi:hypothetical protein
MRGMQEKLLGIIEKCATDVGLEAVIRQDYGNTGMVLIQPVDSFTPALMIGYDFQAHSVCLELAGPAVELLGHVDSPPEFRVYRRGSGGVQPKFGRDAKMQMTYHALDYADGGRFAKMLAVLDELFEVAASEVVA